MSAKYILSLDQGTTSSRAILFDHSGDLIASSQQEFQQIFPKPGWVEHDATEIWQTQLETARAALAEAGAQPSDIAGIGITNQRETTVLWDRQTGEPVANAIVWQDRRTAEYCQTISADTGRAEWIQKRTGLVVDAYFSASKLKWLLDHTPRARTRAEAGELAFGTIDSWLIWQLTGGSHHVTDVSNASRTMLCRLDTAQWDTELLEFFDIPPSVLPEIRPSSQCYGETSPDLFGEPITIAGIAGDQQAALFGQACHQAGMAKNTYGTGCFLLMHTGTEQITSQHDLLTTIAWQLGDQIEYALEGSVFIGGAVVQWLRDQLGIIDSAEEIEALAASVPDSGGVTFVPAFAGLGAPHWDGFARGSIQGLTRGTSKAHLARAALEAIALQVMDLLEAMQGDASIELTELRVDGGASQNELLMQIQADLLDVPVVRAQVAETTALGAAYLAGLATGFWKDQQEIASYWAMRDRFQPSSKQNPDLTATKANWRKAVNRSKAWIDG